MVGRTAENNEILTHFTLSICKASATTLDRSPLFAEIDTIGMRDDERRDGHTRC